MVPCGPLDLATVRPPAAQAAGPEAKKRPRLEPAAAAAVPPQPKQGEERGGCGGNGAQCSIHVDTTPNESAAVAARSRAE
jgi:hypothetical protein